MFIEVYTTDDKNKLLEKGFKLIKEVQISNGTKYVFANTDRLKFDKSEVKCNVTSRLTF